MKTKKNNFNRSDAKTMTVLTKAEILYLRSKGKSIKEISRLTKRSFDWISILIDTFEKSTFSQKLIKQWEKHKNGNRKNQETKTQIKSNISSTSRRVRPKSTNTKRTSKSISKHRTKRYIDITKPGNGKNRSQNNRKSGTLVDTLKNTRDYKNV